MVSISFSQAYCCALELVLDGSNCMVLLFFELESRTLTSSCRNEGYSRRGHLIQIDGCSRPSAHYCFPLYPLSLATVKIVGRQITRSIVARSVTQRSIRKFN